MEDLAINLGVVAGRLSKSVGRHDLSTTNKKSTVKTRKGSGDMTSTCYFQSI